MSITCTRCEGSGFLNVDQVDLEIFDYFQQAEEILAWIKENDNHDVQVCDCCGDGGAWHGMQGEHYNCDDPKGEHGPYGYNGGLCECN